MIVMVAIMTIILICYDISTTDGAYYREFLEKRQAKSAEPFRVQLVLQL